MPTLALTEPSIASRARTAIGRADLSRPLKCAIADGLMNPAVAVFDYGCGRGDDIRRLSAMGFMATGWDPVHRPESRHVSAPVVNIGYVINVIEDLTERREALKRAWDLAEDLLIVSARLILDNRAIRDSSDFRDGCLTSRGTFQKFFEQQELRHWIDQTLQVNAVPAAPGVFYVFRDEEVRTQFVASRFRRRTAAPHLSKSAKLFKEHEDLPCTAYGFCG